MNGWQSLLDSETVKSRISHVQTSFIKTVQVADTPQEWHGSIENIISMCRGTGAVPEAATRASSNMLTGGAISPAVEQIAPPPPSDRHLPPQSKAEI